MSNFLEQLVAEWYEYQGYFVRRNVKVSKRSLGGYGSELDIVALHPKTKIIVHVEPSMDSGSWASRNERYTKKFELGREAIPEIFHINMNEYSLRQIGLFHFASKTNHQIIGGGEILLVSEFLEMIFKDLRDKRTDSEIVPENYPLLRTIQFTMENWKVLARVLEECGRKIA